MRFKAGLKRGKTFTASRGGRKYKIGNEVEKNRKPKAIKLYKITWKYYIKRQKKLHTANQHSNAKKRFSV